MSALQDYYDSLSKKKKKPSSTLQDYYESLAQRGRENLISEQVKTAKVEPQLTRQILQRGGTFTDVKKLEPEPVTKTDVARGLFTSLQKKIKPVLESPPVETASAITKLFGRVAPATASSVNTLLGIQRPPSLSGEIKKLEDPNTTKNLLGTAAAGIFRNVRASSQAAASPFAAVFAQAQDDVTPWQAAKESLKMAKDIALDPKVDTEDGVNTAAQMWLKKREVGVYGGKDPNIADVAVLSALGFFNILGDPALEVGLGLRATKAAKEFALFEKTGTVTRPLEEGKSFIKGQTKDITIPISENLKMKVKGKGDSIIFEGYKKRFSGDTPTSLSPETTDMIMATRNATGREIQATFEGNNLVLKAGNTIETPAIKDVSKDQKPTQTPETGKSEAAEALVEEARKYNSAEEFVKAQGDRYHGTSTEIKKLATDEEIYSPQNIYGQGFYTTDNLSIGEGYSKKGKGKQPTVYKISENKNVPVYDLEKPMDKSLLEKINKMPIAEFESYKNGDTLRQVYDDIRELSASGEFSIDEAQGQFDDIKYNLEQDGFRGLEHTGGKLTGNEPHNVKIYWKPNEDLTFIKAQTKSQLTDIWNKAQETTSQSPAYMLPTVGDETRQQAQILESKQSITDTKESGIAKDIKAETIERGLTEDFPDVASYSPRVIKEQATKVESLISQDVDNVRAMIRGEVPVPSDVSPTYVYSAMSNLASKTGDIELIRELVSSPLASELSIHASELRMAAERNPYSAVSAIKKIQDQRTEAVTKKKKGISITKQKKKIVDEMKKEAPPFKRGDWEGFIKSIQC